MASDESRTIRSLLQQDDLDDEIDEEHHYDHPHHPHNLSRLSVCTSSTICVLDEEDEEDVDDVTRMYMSSLSVESFDADEEPSDGKELPATLCSDSENELGSCFSLPATPPRRRSRVGVNQKLTGVFIKDYASENDAQKKNDPRSSRNRRRRISRNRCSNNSKKKEESSDPSGYGVGGSGFMVITRPKGGSRSLCLDLDEVKACKDLGFELEHEPMLEISTRHSVSNSTLDTSSGGNSPIANWRISSPGDDPRDVKARLKMWAQAVALASTSRHGN